MESHGMVAGRKPTRVLDCLLTAVKLKDSLPNGSPGPNRRCSATAVRCPQLAFIAAPHARGGDNSGKAERRSLMERCSYKASGAGGERKLTDQRDEIEEADPC
jgi:hypothetical protein